MGERQVRVGQLIAPFGPGSLYVDRRGMAHVICGLDHWHKQHDARGRLVICERLDEFDLFEPRLASLLRVPAFRIPADFRVLSSGSHPPPNAQIYTPTLRFPTWHRSTKSGRLVRFNLETKVLPRPVEGGRWVPVRFVAACEAGHLSDFPWKEWAGCSCTGDGELLLTDFGGSDLTSIQVECKACGSGKRNLAGVTQRPALDDSEDSAFKKRGIYCHGERPWLGSNAEEACTAPLVGALINQTNLYFAETVSAIFLPAMHADNLEDERIREMMVNDATAGISAKFMWDRNRRREAVSHVKVLLGQRGVEATDDTIERALMSLFDSDSARIADAAVPLAPESEMQTFKRAEFDVLRSAQRSPLKAPSLEVSPAMVPRELQRWISQVHLLGKLRETRVFCGFDRLQHQPKAPVERADQAMRQLFRFQPRTPEERWLPAIAVHGEGIFISLSEEALSEWQERTSSLLAARLDDRFVARLAARPQTLAPSGTSDWRWASRYLLVHGLAHIIINQLVFECGYATASLRERLFVSADEAAPMAAFLIYTAAGDSEGTLGGLVRLGHPDRLDAMLRRALSRASWCSADPVCSENLGGTGTWLANLAACHACMLLPETSCETINHGLDRAMIVGTPMDRELGMFSELLRFQHSLS